jgi:hypothetical protein
VVQRLSSFARPEEIVPGHDGVFDHQPVPHASVARDVHGGGLSLTACERNRPSHQAAPQRLYYLQATARFGWSRNLLLNQVEAQAFERSLAEGKSHNFPKVRPEHLAEQAEEALKSGRSLEFLG